MTFREFLRAWCIACVGTVIGTAIIIAWGIIAIGGAITILLYGTPGQVGVPAPFVWWLAAFAWIALWGSLASVVCSGRTR